MASQGRAAEAMRKVNAEARRADEAEAEGSRLAVALEESEERAAEAIVRVSELEEENDVLRTENDILKSELDAAHLARRPATPDLNLGGTTPVKSLDRDRRPASRLRRLPSLAPTSGVSLLAVSSALALRRGEARRARWMPSGVRTPTNRAPSLTPTTGLSSRSRTASACSSVESRSMAAPRSPVATPSSGSRWRAVELGDGEPAQPGAWSPRSRRRSRRPGGRGARPASRTARAGRPRRAPRPGRPSSRPRRCRG